MKKIIIFLLLLIPVAGIAQSYVFPPEIKFKEMPGLDSVKVSVVFQDNRTYTRKLNERCTKEELFQIFAGYIQKSLPGVSLTVLEEEKYNDEPQSGVVTLKINLLKYESVLMNTVYIAPTKYKVVLTDKRGEPKEFTETITIEARQMNTLGHKSGQIAANTSFRKALEKLISMFDKLK